MTAPRRIALLGGLLSLLLLASSCYRTTLVFEPTPPTPNALKLRRNHLIGLVELEGPIAIDGVCPNGAAQIYQRQGAISIGLAIITAGFANGRDVMIWCRSGARYQAKAGRDGMLRDVRRTDL